MNPTERGPVPSPRLPSNAGSKLGYFFFFFRTKKPNASLDSFDIPRI